jgi:hypothetical protein
MSAGEARSRRDVLLTGMRLALVVVGTAACGKTRAPQACLDVAALAPDDAHVRTVLAYTEPAPDPDKSCGSCQQFVAAADAGKCGACKVLKGPINPDGTCKVFTPKSA